jgi:methyltransferase OMS1
MGLCSTPDPAALLCQLGRFVKPDTGRIILLEHGRSHYQWMNNILDQHAPAHADRHGCWWNRDIGEIVERSGLEVVKMRRFHLGTTWWVELKVKTNRKDEKEEVAAVDKEG